MDANKWEATGPERLRLRRNGQEAYMTAGNVVAYLNERAELVAALSLLVRTVSDSDRAGWNATAQVALMDPMNRARAALKRAEGGKP